MRTYEDFELWISAEEEGFRAQAKGAGESQRFELDAKALAERWKRLVSAFTGRDRATPQEIQVAEALGGELFRAVFTDKILFAWGAALARAQERGRKAGVRLVLRVQEARDLASLPWELLFEGRNRGPLALSVRTPIIRYPDVQERPRQLVLRPPLRVLGVLAEPRGQALLDLEGEWQEIEKALLPRCGRSLIQIERLVSPTLTELRQRLKRDPAIHAIHFAGHGVAGALDLLKEFRDRRSEPALGQQLATLVDDASELRLVVINACEGAIGIDGESTTSVAFHLARRGLPAVVAFQSALCDKAARIFAKAFYKALAKGGPLEVAVAEARVALHDAHKGLAWAAPVLYLRAPTGRIFDRIIASYWKLLRCLGAGILSLGLLGLLALGSKALLDVWKRINRPVASTASDPECPSPSGLNFAFQLIRPGAFDMGAPEGRGDPTNERPIHRVKLTAPLCVGAFEVTSEQVDAIMIGSSVKTRPGKDSPAVKVSWSDTERLLEKLNERDPGARYRLLTEAEWEYAAKGGGIAAFAFGENPRALPDHGNCLGEDDGFAKLAPIGSFPSNQFGLYDLHGNVQEWVADWFGLYSSAEVLQVDPRGPETGTQRVRRGGSFDTNASNCVSWSRGKSYPDRRQNDLGFRIARSPKYNPAQ